LDITIHIMTDNASKAKLVDQHIKLKSQLK